MKPQENEKKIKLAELLDMNFENMGSGNDLSMNDYIQEAVQQSFS